VRAFLKQSLLIPVIVLGGCAVGPDFVPPESPKLATYSDEGTGISEDGEIRLVTADAVPEQWWRLYNSEQLTRLVEQGLQNSPDLAAAKARLEAAAENLRADTGWVLFPSVDANANSSRQRITGAAFGSAGNPSVFNVHNASVNIAYTIDAFGGGQRHLEYGAAKVDYDAFQLQASRLTLIANIITAAITEASLREQIQATEVMIADEAEMLELTGKQFRIGVIPKAALLAQQTALAQTQTLLPSLQKALAQNRHFLAALLGKYPSGNDLPQIRLDELSLPQELPLTLPSTLTQRRPDVRAAEATLHQANAQIGVATANLYPKLSLSGSYATEATRIADLFSAGTSVWGLAAGLTQPLFRAGELRARKRAAVAEFNQAAALYRQSVLSAFRDVADAMLAIEADSRALHLQQQAEKYSAETLALVREQHRQGAVSYLALLDAQNRYQLSRIELIRARATLFSDSAALIYALGGGWWGGAQAAESGAMEKPL